MNRAKFFDNGPKGERDYEDGGDRNLPATPEMTRIAKRDADRAAALPAEIAKWEAAVGHKLDPKNSKNDAVALATCRKNVAWRIS